MNTDHTDHQPALIGNAVIDGDGILRPTIITARHWSDGDIEIAIRPLHIPNACIIIDRADLAAINTLLRAQPAIPVDGHPDPDPAAPHIQFTPSDTPSYQLTEHWQRIDELTSGMIALEERLHTLSGVVRAQATEIADLRSRLARVADDGTAIGRVAARAANMESYYDAERDAAPVSSAESRLTELEEQFDALQEVVRVIYTQSPTAQQDQINTWQQPLPPRAYQPARSAASATPAPPVSAAARQAAPCALGGSR